MFYMKLKSIAGLALLLTVVGTALVSIPTAQAGNVNAVDLPYLPCDELQVEAGNELAFHAYATGVQIYKWNGVSWGFVGPSATLFADANYKGVVGIHYGGPTWESNSGSSVVATRVNGCTPDPTAIPWLKLQTTSTKGHGVFSAVTFIQRVNTTGGLAPTAPGATIGAVVEVPYTAEYYFYRAED